MCFSAPISFAASGLLTVAGAASMRKAKKSARLVAAIPFLFAAQQFIEGLQWLGVNKGEPSMLLAYIYLFFAFLFWPVYIPLTSYLNEKDTGRRKVLAYFVFGGSLIALYLLVNLFIYPLTIDSACCGIGYEMIFPYWKVTGLAYVLILVGSLFLSTDRYFKIFSILVFLSAFLSWLIFYLAFTSVWCFFAAALSGLIVYYFYGRK